MAPCTCQVHPGDASSARRPDQARSHRIAKDRTIAAVPTCIGGAVTFAWGATDTAYRKLSRETLQHCFIGSGIVARYYNPEIHIGAFALPQYGLPAVNKPGND